jgi:excisionase family DNA binding protein
MSDTPQPNDSTRPLRSQISIGKGPRSDTPQPNDSTRPRLEPLQVDVIEAARLLRYSRAKIYLMLSSGELPSTRHGTSRRIPVVALRAWVEAHTEHGL